MQSIMELLGGYMNCEYESVTASATDAITAMVETPHNATICTAAEVQALAAYVFFSWLRTVGRTAKRIDAKKMADLIVSML